MTYEPLPSHLYRNTTGEIDMAKKVGRPKMKKKADLFKTGSIRLSDAQWKLFKAWGGAEQLRKHLAKVKGGQARHAAP